MPQYTPVIYFYICQLCCCCCWAPSLAGLKRSRLQDFSWPQISTSLLKSTLSKAVENPMLIKALLLFYYRGTKCLNQYVWLRALLHLHLSLSESCMSKWECERETTRASAVLFSLSSPLFFSFHLSPTVPSRWDDMSKWFCQASWVD